MRMREIINLVEAKYDFDDGNSYERRDPVIAKYMEGHCYALAVAHHRKFGWPIYVVGCSEDDMEEYGGDVDFFHGLVKHPTGVLLDISGPHDPQEFYEAYGEPVAPISEADLLRLLSDFMRSQTLSGLAEAERIIDRYLKPKFPHLYP